MTIKIESFEQYRKVYRESTEDPERFWSDQAKSFYWRQKWSKTLEWNFEEPSVKWFVDGKLNITENCLDRHLKNNADSIALIWEPNDPSAKTKRYTYRELHEKVCQCANALLSLGIEKGDRICLYMPMVPELAIAVLASARIGAIHSVVFAGFSAQALHDRIVDASAKLVICADFNNRGAKHIPVKSIVDDALAMGCPSVAKVLVLQNADDQIELNTRDIWWHDVVTGAEKMHTAEMMDAEDELFILYTSGSTGQPKGVVHTCGGYMVYTCFSFRNVFQYDEGDIYWCTADIGWITGHSYIIYGPLLAGATTVMFEGVPTYPDAGRFWQICEKLRVNQFYTAPTAIRALMAQGDAWVKKYDLSSIKVLGTVGEPINKEAWDWYNDLVGKGECPIVDTWWQTETGGIMITSIPGVTDQKPTFACYPLPGIQPALVTHTGEEITEMNASGLLCIKAPWPSMIRTTYGDHERCRKTYFSAFSGMYFTGDGALRDAEGRYRITGRVDDVLNVSGHRLGTAEIENAINGHPGIIESAVVGYPHSIKGEGIFAFVICDLDGVQLQEVESEVRKTVAKQIGPIAKPDIILPVPGLPKTRSGKIMRRILRKLASGHYEGFGDISTLLNPEIVEEIIKIKLASEERL